MTDQQRDDPEADERRAQARSRDRDVDRRFEQIERAQSSMREEVTRVMHTIELVVRDQGNFSKLMELRFLAIEKSQAVAESKIDGILRETSGLRADIIEMAGDSAKTPAGRGMEEKIATATREATAARELITEDCRDLREKLEALISYKDRFEGAMWMLYIGVPSGVTALGWLIVKFLAERKP